MTGRTGQPSIRGREQGQRVEISRMWQRQDQDGKEASYRKTPRGLRGFSILLVLLKTCLNREWQSSLGLFQVKTKFLPLSLVSTNVKIRETPFLSNRDMKEEI